MKGSCSIIIFHLSTMAMELIYMSLSTRLLFFIVFVIFHLGLNRQEIDFFFFQSLCRIWKFQVEDIQKNKSKKKGGSAIVNCNLLFSFKQN